MHIHGSIQGSTEKSELNQGTRFDAGFVMPKKTKKQKEAEEAERLRLEEEARKHEEEERKRQAEEEKQRLIRQSEDRESEGIRIGVENQKLEDEDAEALPIHKGRQQRLDKDEASHLKEEDWRKFVRCNELPDPGNTADMNTYMQSSVSETMVDVEIVCKEIQKVRT